MNVIITNLSMLKSDAKPGVYHSDLGDIPGTNTNDAPVTYLMTLLARNTPQEPVRIIAVTTPEAMPAFEAFSEMVSERSRALGINCPEIRRVDAKEMAQTIRNVIALTPKDARVYIDTTGGFRNSSYLLMAVVRILEYSGIQFRRAVYALFKPINRIEDVTANYRLFDLISAANSFTEFGNSTELTAFFKEHSHPEVQRVLSAMNAFSEAVALCRTSGLDEILSGLSDSLLRLDTMQTDDGNEILFQSISGVIRQKFGISSGSARIEYTDVIAWCLRHQLIQQAVTIYTEKIGSYLLRRGFLTADQKTVREFEKNANHFDLQYRLFYEGFMTIPVSYAACPTPIGRFLRTIKGNESVIETLAGCTCAEDFLQDMPIYSARLGKYERQGIDRICRLKYAVFGKGSIRLRPDAVRLHLQKFPEFAEIPDKCKGGTPVKFINELINNQNLHAALQGEYENAVHVYENSRINTIEYLGDALQEQKHFTLHTGIPQMQSIMRDYLYIKNYLRNTFNHASDDESRTPEETAYLAQHGYPTGDTPTLQDVVRIMQKAIHHIQESHP